MSAAYLQLLDHMKFYGSIDARVAKSRYGMSSGSFRGRIRDLKQVIQIDSRPFKVGHLTYVAHSLRNDSP
jgi:hypothetical protein